MERINDTLLTYHKEAPTLRYISLIKRCKVAKSLLQVESNIFMYKIMREEEVPVNAYIKKIFRFDWNKEFFIPLGF
ncbi:Hypothetical protein SRAE_0000061800 [Strongyloides ratti]|uniref:Uncharacterized protein n=1 Tax=Strongyloides ratti TaxID=34506 RepID=A0A090KVE9_STRRB|nr:Hypothetical protein SRAE_0000061800 [Strongyloides ratti]CEF61495.1 Hypothetical protein SRAE_0000061800 [Strongyloides ratti]